MANANKRRVLVVFAEPFLYGGQESFMINVFNNINHDRFHLDFLTPFNSERPDVASMLNASGSSLIHGDHNFNTSLRKKYFVSFLTDFLKNKPAYDVVHINSGSSFALSRGASIVRKYIPNARIILHSHATGYNSIRHSITTFLLRRGFKKANLLVGCSQEALEHRFTKSIVKTINSIVVGSGVDHKRFSFSNKARLFAREQLSIPNTSFVIGHVGRFTREKNHSFILEVFKNIHEKHTDSFLLLVGDGPDLEEAERQAADLGIKKNVRFVKPGKDIQGYLCSMDSFIFPSLFEGFGMAAVEAQASGLPVFCSDRVPKDVLVSEAAFSVSLSLGPKEWAQRILDFYSKNPKRLSSRGFLVSDNIDLRKISKVIEDAYA